MRAQLFGPDVRIAATRRGLKERWPLLGAEREAASRFAPARAREFAAGRACARFAMRALRHPEAPVPQAADRSPCWPSGLVGSISHSPTWCVAALARTADGYRSLGLDIEPLLPLPPDVEEEILLDAERRWIADQPLSRRTALGRLHFSAKECAYKCQFPLSRRLLDFRAVAIRVHWTAQSFTARFTTDAPPFRTGDVLEGRFAVRNRHFVCAIELKHPASHQPRETMPFALRPHAPATKVHP